MATPYVLKGSEGFDIYDDGPMVQSYPWFIHTQANVGQIVSGSGVFSGKCLSLNQGTTLAATMSYALPTTGTFMRNNTVPAGKAVFGINCWYRCDTVPSNTTVNNILTLTSASNTAQNVPILGISNTVANGLQLAFPSSVAGITTTPYQLAIQTGQWYWLSIKFALYPNAQLLASYYVNTIAIQENVPITFGTDPLGSNVANRLMFWAGGVLGTWSMDDMVIQASSGADDDWPAGFSGGAPNNPTINSLLTVSPRRIVVEPVTANGSVIQMTPSDPELENWEAATTEGDFVEALDSDQTDLYKVTVNTSVPMADCIGVRVIGDTNKYLSMEPSMKDSASDEQVNSPGVTSKNVSRFVSIMEQNSAGETWNTTTIGDAEFGQHSI